VKTLKTLLSVVPEMGMLNLFPSSSKKSINVVNDKGETNVKLASHLTFYFVTPRLLPSGKFNLIGILPTSFAILNLSS
jgi:hypothetical protein